MYRLILESLLGLRLEVDRLHFKPCLPAHWPAVTIHYRYRETTYRIVVNQLPATEWTSSDAMKVIVDGTVQPDAAVPLVDDGHAHTVEITVPVAPRMCDAAQSVVPTTNNLPLESPANSPCSDGEQPGSMG